MDKPKVEKAVKDIKSKSTIDKVDAKIFGPIEFNSQLLSQIVISLQSNQRVPSAHTKTRGEVAGTTRKPWRQKGTGRARVGTRRNPIWRGGGAAFGPLKERNFHKKINKKSMISALKMVLTKKSEAGEIIKIESLPKDISKTRDILKALSSVLSPRSNLLIIKEKDSNLEKVLKNVKYINLTVVNKINLLEAISAYRIIFTTDALKALRDKLKA